MTSRADVHAFPDILFAFFINFNCLIYDFCFNSGSHTLCPLAYGLSSLGRGAHRIIFVWAFARHFGGTFILRVEDTDLERSTPEAVQAILDGMNWLGLTPDEGPFYQMQHMERYRAVVAGMLAAGTAYHCYSSNEEVEAMRDLARSKGAKPRSCASKAPKTVQPLGSIW